MYYIFHTILLFFRQGKTFILFQKNAASRYFLEYKPVI